ncbi:PilT protein domain protein, partial [mine drainage metagenome]
MKLLLDTHVFLWWVSDAPELSETARAAISDPANACCLSLASCWEMAIKSSVGKL